MVCNRSWNNNILKADEIKFFNKNGKLIKWERGLKLLAQHAIDTRRKI